MGSRLVRQRGEQRGIQIGEQRGEAELTLHLLRLKLGPLPSQVEAQIRALSIPQLHQLADQLFELDSLEGLIQGLAEYATKSSS
ncbi:MAG: DUF4351 domain-containing protein [Synechococcaceae cyanobacterium SM2_3_1]|nr:DUF4351 domain-containing protein [Synechococcaceae cyanobacterium SM2_3_1]